MYRLTMGIGLALLGAGCSCGPTNERDLYADEIGALCNFYARCGLIGRSEESKCYTTALATYDMYGSSTSSYDVNAAMKAGRLAIDPGAANTCIGAIKQTSCSGSGTLFLNSNSACEKVYKGGVSLGSTCASTYECANGQCQQTSGGTTCGGICVALAAEGASCLTTGCDTTKDFCDNTRVCRPRGVIGSACSQFLYGNDCQPGLGCSSTNTCAKPGGAGEPCASGACNPGYHCVGTTSSPVCAANVAHGQLCADPGACPDGDRCVGPQGGTGTCTTIGDIGSVCDPMLDTCPYDAPCDPTSHICSQNTMGAEGSVCTTSGCNGSSFSVVSVPLYCDSSTHVCTKKLKVNDSCTPPTSGSDPCITSCSSATRTCTAPTSCF